MSRSTNAEFVTAIMESHPLAQVFVLEALHHYSTELLAQPVIPDTGKEILSPSSWRACAESVNTKLKERY